MFPREARNTRNTSRSSFDNTQNSQVAKPPESSVSQAGQLSRVNASRSSHTGQLRGGRRPRSRFIYSAETRTLPIVHSTSRVPAPDPKVTSLPVCPRLTLSVASPSHVTLPRVVRAVTRTLDPFSRLILTEPISH